MREMGCGWRNLAVTQQASCVLRKGPQVPLVRDKNDHFIKQELSTSHQEMETLVQKPDLGKKTWEHTVLQFLSLTTWASFPQKAPKREGSDVLPCPILVSLYLTELLPLMTPGSELSNFVVLDVIRRAQWNSWFHCGGDFFQRIILFREVTTVLILSFTKARAKFPKGKGIKSENH